MMTPCYDDYFFLIAVFFLINLPSSRLQCSDPNTLKLLCKRGAIEMSFLDNPFPPDVSLEVRCNNNGDLRGWSWSPDGAENTAVILNASAKYTMSGTTLHINDVNSMDEGLYRCVYQGGLVNQKCIYVFARAVFAACPRSPNGCSSTELISFTAGENITFNASIIHISGGSCGFEQIIQRVELRRCINNTCTSQSPLLSSVNPDQEATNYNGDVRVSSSKERDLAYIFTLSNAALNNSGLYQVTVMGKHPSFGDSTSIKREYYLVTINDGHTTTPNANKQETTTTAMDPELSTFASKTIKPSHNISTTYEVTSTDHETTPLDVDNSPLPATTIISIVMGVVTIVLVVIISVAVIVYYCRKERHRKDPTAFSNLIYNTGAENPQVEGAAGDTVDAQQVSNEPKENGRDGSVLPHSFNENQENGTNSLQLQNLGCRTDTELSSTHISNDSAVEVSEQYPSGNQDSIRESQTEDNPQRQSEPDVAAEPQDQQRSNESQQTRRGRLRLDLSSKPAISDLLNEVAAKTPNKWREIGIQLGLTNGRIEAIELKHRGSSTKIFIDIFDHWEKQQGDEPKTWLTVINVLKAPIVGEETLANDLELSMTMTQHSTSSTNSPDNSHMHDE